MSSDDYLSDLRALIDRASSVMLAAAPAPGDRSAQTALDALVDAAALYQQRLETALDRGDLVLDAAHDGPGEAPPADATEWSALVTVWWMHATHFARSLAAIPAADRRRPHARHNLHETLWRPVPADAPATLDDLGRDYAAHLRHHLRLLGVLADVPSGNGRRAADG